MKLCEPEKRASGWLEQTKYLALMKFSKLSSLIYGLGIVQGVPKVFVYKKVDKYINKHFFWDTW